MARFWKQGFYDEPIEGGVEITEEYWRALLTGQENGMEIQEDIAGYPVLGKHKYTYEELVMIKEAEIKAYDSSENVNQFILNGDTGWFDKSKRAGLRNSLPVEQMAGRTATKIWIHGNKHIIPIEDAINMINRLEIYALDCNDRTEEHLDAIKKLNTKEEFDSYDHTKGYPDKLIFNIKENEESIL